MFLIHRWRSSPFQRHGIGLKVLLENRNPAGKLRDREDVSTLQTNALRPKCADTDGILIERKEFTRYDLVVR